MSCDKYKDALLQLAVSGRDFDDGLANHLRRCSHCHATLQHEQDVLAKMENVLRRRMNEEPSVGLLTRVHSEISKEKLSPMRWNPTWAVAWAALALVLVVIAKLPTGSRSHPIQSAKVAIPATPGTHDVAPHERLPIAESNSRIRTRPRTKKSATQQTVANRDPEVLVPQDEAKAFRQFVERLGESQEIAQAFVNGSASEDDALSEISPVEIAEMRLKPLVWEKWR